MSDILNNISNLLSGYNGNTNLKREGIKINWTGEQIREYNKCKNDVIYFAENYVHVVHPDRGFEKITLYPYQKDLIKLVEENTRVVALSTRQSGKCLYSKSFINIRNKKTGDIQKIAIEYFYNLSKLKNESANNLSSM